MKRFSIWSAALVLGLLLVSSCVQAEVISQKFEHQLLVNSQPQSWEHRIDLPENMMQQGLYFLKRDLQVVGRLVIEREVLTRTSYYIKVRLPKHYEEPMYGAVTVSVEASAQTPAGTPVAAPTEVKLFEVAPALRPVITWKGDTRFAHVTLYDLDENATVLERVTVNHKYASVVEGWLKQHHYRWAIKLADDFGKTSKEVQVGFRIETQNGVVVVVPE